jgi:hypothetical protein
MFDVLYVGIYFLIRFFVFFKIEEGILSTSYQKKLNSWFNANAGPVR